MPTPTIILVHGAFADASSWTAVYDELKGDGLPIIAAAGPLRGVDLRRRIPQVRPRPSRGRHRPGRPLVRWCRDHVAGAHERVKALVYIAGYAPEEGETLGQLQGRFPDSPLAAVLQFTPLADGGTDVTVDPQASPRSSPPTSQPSRRTSWPSPSVRSRRRCSRNRPGRVVEDDTVLRPHPDGRQDDQPRRPPLRLRAGRHEDHRSRWRVARRRAVTAGGRRWLHPPGGCRRLDPDADDAAHRPTGRPARDAVLTTIGDALRSPWCRRRRPAPRR